MLKNAIALSFRSLRIYSVHSARRVPLASFSSSRAEDVVSSAATVEPSAGQKVDLGKLAQRERWEDLKLAIDRKNYTYERGVALSSDKFPAVAEVMRLRGWKKLFATPSAPDDTLVKEFYHNVPKITKAGDVLCRGKKVKLTSSAINAHYGISKNTEDGFQALVENGVKRSTLLGCIACPNPSFAEEGSMMIPYKILNNEAKVWHKIVSTRLKPSGNTNIVSTTAAVLIYALMTGVPIDIGKVILQSIKDAATTRAGNLVFPSLITGLCAKSGIDLIAEEHRKTPMNLTDNGLSHLAMEQTARNKSVENETVSPAEGHNARSKSVKNKTVSPAKEHASLPHVSPEANSLAQERTHVASDSEPAWFRSYRRSIDARFNHYDLIFQLLANKQGVSLHPTQQSDIEPAWFRSYRRANDAKFRHYDLVFRLLTNQLSSTLPSPLPPLFDDWQDAPDA